MGEHLLLMCESSRAHMPEGYLHKDLKKLIYELSDIKDSLSRKLIESLASKICFGIYYQNINILPTENGRRCITEYVCSCFQLYIGRPLMMVN